MPPKKDFQWSDDEAELLLTVTNEYKVAKIAEGVDWESVKSKYVDILQLMRNELPSSEEEGRNLLKDYPHTKEQVTKQILTSKLKAIRLKFRQAVDSGKKSGYGRVVMLYYEACQKIWGGSPATEQIEGIESTDSNIQLAIPSEHDAQASGDEGEESDVIEGASAQEPTQQATAENTTAQHRRELLNDKLKNFRQEKLKRKLPVDAQLLECAKEELQVKKQLMEQMFAVDKEYKENLMKLSTNMEKLTNSIADSFSLLRNVLTSQPHMQARYPPYPPPTIYGDSTHPVGERRASPY